MEDPTSREPGPNRERRYFTLAEYLTLLSDLARDATCPICRNNKGWIRPPGLERIAIPSTREKPVEAFPYACSWCGFIRLHLVSDDYLPSSEERHE
jgi:hypothetical protein